MNQDSNSVGATRHKIKLNERDVARFWAKVDKSGPTMPHMDTPCWVWTAGTFRRGYGMFQLSNKARYSHRISFVLAGGVLSEEKPNSLHRCDNPPCVNPAHLFAGSDMDNARDRTAKGRNNAARGDANGARLHPETRARGEKHGKSKLTDAECEYIRSSPLSGAALGRKLGFSRSQINKIRRGHARLPFSTPQPPETP